MIDHNKPILVFQTDFTYKEGVPDIVQHSRERKQPGRGEQGDDGTAERGYEGEHRLAERLVYRSAHYTEARRDEVDGYYAEGSGAHSQKFI